jgi:hypothetical protein
MSRTSRPLDLRIRKQRAPTGGSSDSSMSADPGSPRLKELQPKRPISVEVEQSMRWASRSASTAFM